MLGIQVRGVKNERLQNGAPRSAETVGNFLSGHAKGVCVGDEDGLRFDTTKLHEVFDRYGIVNTFTIYPGTHTSAVADRFQNFVMPFFSKNLCFTTTCN